MASFMERCVFYFDLPDKKSCHIILRRFYPPQVGSEGQTDCTDFVHREADAYDAYEMEMNPLCWSVQRGSLEKHPQMQLWIWIFTAQMHRIKKNFHC